MLERYKVNKMDDLLILVNKQPQWSDGSYVFFTVYHVPYIYFHADSQAYVLNFHGRVTQASVKNFQLVHSANSKCGITHCKQLFTFDLCS